jgi:phosphoribosyl 1,2-cyclic phosphodiesterase
VSTAASRRPRSPFRFAVLASGSQGNATLIECGATRLLLDCGLTLEQTERRLARLGVAGETLMAILITHEHADHVRSLVPLARRYKLPVWLTAGTAKALDGALKRLPGTKILCAGEAFALGDLKIEPFAVPHDACEPVQFVFSDGHRRLGVLTDAGAVPDGLRRALDGCDALILECNHDRTLLEQGPYPAFLKARIAGPHGHLDNETAAALLAGLDQRRLRHVVAAHLSPVNNRPALARRALAAALGASPAEVEVADAENGLPWRALC